MTTHGRTLSDKAMGDLLQDADFLRILKTANDAYDGVDGLDDILRGSVGGDTLAEYVTLELAEVYRETDGDYATKLRAIISALDDGSLQLTKTRMALRSAYNDAVDLYRMDLPRVNVDRGGEGPVERPF